MKLVSKELKVCQIALNELSLEQIDLSTDNLVFISNNLSRVCDGSNLKDFIIENLSNKDNRQVLFISKNDNHNAKGVAEIVKIAKYKSADFAIMILVPYLQPPIKDAREDGEVRSFLADAEQVSEKDVFDYFRKSNSLVYHTVYRYLNSIDKKGLAIHQVGKEPYQPIMSSNKIKQLLSGSMVVIPHKGTLKLLNRALSHLNQTNSSPGFIKICFDDHSYNKLELESYKNLKSKIAWSVNKPVGCGPYLGRHYSIIEQDSEHVFFQDSDDISVHSRFERQIEELSSRSLDLIGSHELRVDQFQESLMLIRFPIDVNKAFEKRPYHPLFHPTSMITKKAYIKTKGFSTDMTFGYDLQLTFRAKYILKMGNVDDFLYVRFKRPGSLTTHPKTKLGSSLRSFLWWRWRVEMRLINEGKLDLEASCLSVQRHAFQYRMIAQGKF